MMLEIPAEIITINESANYLEATNTSIRSSFKKFLEKRVAKFDVAFL